ncbi:reverse transcriptase domain-containing protein [Tanacetum coccineum]
MPKALISDRGTQFCNKLMEKVMKRYDVTLLFSTSYHLEMSRQVENTNRAIKIILEKTMKGNPVVWLQNLDDALWAFRTAYKTPTGTTPYKLLYGKNCHLLFEIEHRAYWALKNCNPNLIEADEPPANAAENVKAAWKAEYKIHSDVACLMLGKMSPALQRQFELYFPQAMLNELRKMFEKPPAVEIYDLVDTLHSCKQAPGKSVSAHVLEMKGYMDQLQALGKPYDNDMAINLREMICTPHKVMCTPQNHMCDAYGTTSHMHFCVVHITLCGVHINSL